MLEISWSVVTSILEVMLANDEDLFLSAQTSAQQVLSLVHLNVIGGANVVPRRFGNNLSIRRKITIRPMYSRLHQKRLDVSSGNGNAAEAHPISW